MTAIVMNTLNAAVTEYDWSFQSITPTHAGSASGLFALGGDLDHDAAISASFLAGLTLLGETQRKTASAVYFANKLATAGELRVKTPDDEYAYPLLVRAKGIARGVPGKGIRENRLAFGYRNTDGADFSIDQMQVEINQSTRRL